MISVCIATYNGEKYIQRQLSSILSQLGRSDEVVISDDGSTDATLDIIRNFNDSRIRILPSRKFSSPIFNFEYTLANATGDIIFLADQDDEWVGDKIATCLPYLEKYDCITSDCIVVDEHDTVINKSFFELNKTKGGAYYNLLIKNGYLGCCMAFKRKILEKALPFPSNIPMHDIWLGNVAAFFYSHGLVHEPLIRFNRHGDNASVTAQKSPFSLWKKFMFRYHIIVGLLNRRIK